MQANSGALEEIIATDAEVLAICAWLDLKWPFPLPTIVGNVLVEASRVDEAARELGLERGVDAKSALAKQLARTLVAIIDSRPQAAVYPLGIDGEVTGWIVLHKDVSGVAISELVSRSGQHRMSTGRSVDVTEEYARLLDELVAASSFGGTATPTAVLVIGERDEDVVVIDLIARTATLKGDQGQFNSDSAQSWTGFRQGELIKRLTSDAGDRDLRPDGV